MRKDLLGEYLEMAAEMFEHELKGYSEAIRRPGISNSADCCRDRAAKWGTVLLALRALAGQQEGE